jgi:predicted ribosome quality control (RQC) complex YloA/Tae2 family protein
MSLNWKEIDLVLREIDAKGSHVQKIEQPDFSSLVLQCYRPGTRFSLLISLAQGKNRLHLIENKRTKQVGLQRFAQLLRSRIDGGRIENIEQLGSERIIRIDIIRGGEETILYLRLWGGAANIIACRKDGTILDSFYRRPSRGEVSGSTFSPEALDLKKSNDTDQKKFQIRTCPDDGSRTPFNHFLENHYTQLEETQKRQQLVKQSRLLCVKKISWLSATITRLEDQLYQAMDCERLKEYGDLIMSHQHLIKKGDKKLICNNYYRRGEELEIPLNPTSGAAANGEAYYHRYKKEKRKQQFIEQELASAVNELERYKLFLENVDLNKTVSEIEEFIRTEKSDRQRNATNNDKITGLRFFSHGFTILVGRNAKENDLLLRSSVKGNDYWLHTRDYPGGYVFIRNIPGKTVPLEVLLDAGNLALFFSQGKSGGKGDLYYTQVKHLRRAKHGKTGMVIPTQEKNISIVLDQPRLDRLLGRKEVS